MAGPVWTSVGMCESFTFTPKPQLLKHYAWNQGIKLIDKMAFISLEAEIAFKIDEFIADNFVMGLLGTAVSAGDIEIGNAITIERQVQFSGTNNFGANVLVTVPHVFFYCDKAIEFIDDADWGHIELTGEPLLTAGNFGTVQFLDSPSGAPEAALNTANYYCGKGNVYTAPLA